MHGCILSHTPFERETKAERDRETEWGAPQTSRSAHTDRQAFFSSRISKSHFHGAARMADNKKASAVGLDRPKQLFQTVSPTAARETSTTVAGRTDPLDSSSFFKRPSFAVTRRCVSPALLLKEKTHPPIPKTHTRQTNPSSRRVSGMSLQTSLSHTPNSLNNGLSRRPERRGTPRDG